MYTYMYVYIIYTRYLLAHPLKLFLNFFVYYAILIKFDKINWKVNTSKTNVLDLKF